MENYQNRLFVGGDISGIQNFIYNITSRKAAVSLKGRSAWLSEYMKQVYDSVLALPEIKDSPLTEPIYCGGGKFYLAVPDTDKVRSALSKLRHREEELLWDKHYGQLAFNLAIVPYQSDFSANFDLASAEFAKQKSRKFESLLHDKYDAFFGVQPVGGTTHVCAITGIEGQTVKLAKGEDIDVLPSVKEQVELGRKIRKEYQNLSETDTFENYAQGSYLGVLRMDVDNLGSAFRSYKTKDEYSIFSKQLTDFFEKRLSQIWHEKYHDKTDVIYAGGDDLFIVGKWNVIVDFAERIHDEFMLAFPKLTLSGGMAIVGAKFPIAKAAELAGETENKSKHFNADQKNAFTLLGTTVSWQNEFDYVKRQKRQFVDLCKRDNMPRAILHKLMALNVIRQRGELRYMWNMVYFLKRFAEGKTDNVKALCNQLKTELLDNRKFELVALAAQWAELELRDNNNN